MNKYLISKKPDGKETGLNSKIEIELVYSLYISILN